jgi:hypothetical protein
VGEHVTEGRNALRFDSRAPAGNIQFSGFEKDWSKYDSLTIDLFNPSDKPIMIGGWIRAVKLDAGWKDRYNYERLIKPGFSTLRFSTGGLTTSSGQNQIDTKNVVSFNIAVDRATLFIDNIRLIQGIEEIPVAGLMKFDAGPPNSAVIPGFTRLGNDVYEKERGWGWLPGGKLGKPFDMSEMLGRHRPPDELCRDFLQPEIATFAVDLPNGIYGVWVMLGPPGNGWGPPFSRRAIKVNGMTVIENIYDAKSYQDFEFGMQDSEDLPGDDLWERYIRPIFKGQRFDAEVKDGQLRLAFEGSGVWSMMLNGLALWPKASESDAERWLDSLEILRKEQYQSQHVEKLPPAPPRFNASDADIRGLGFDLPENPVRKNLAVNWRNTPGRSI